MCLPGQVPWTHGLEQRWLEGNPGGPDPRSKQDHHQHWIGLAMAVVRSSED